MPRKAALYLDTSVPNALFQEPPERAGVTSLFYRDVLRRFEVFVSELVLAEIEATPDAARRQSLLESVEGFSMLSVSAEAERLATEYLKYLRIPQPDALHIAIATVEGMDYLVTWNMEHVAREQTRRIVDNVNFLHGLHRLFIVTPRDLFAEV